MDLAALFREDQNAAQDRATSFSTMYNAREKHLSDLYKQKLESDRYAQLTPHEVNIKALEGNRALQMNTPEMRNAYGMGQLGTFGEQFAKGTKALGTLDSDITAGNAENNQKTMTALITKFSQMADFADAAYTHGGDQAVIASIPPELAQVYQKELASGKSGKEIINGFRTKIGLIKNKMMENASYDPKYFAEARLHEMDNTARIKEAGIRANAQHKSDSNANLMYYRTRLGQEAGLIKSLQQVLSSGSGMINGNVITGIKPGTVQYENLQATLADAMDNYNTLAEAVGDKSRYDSARYRDKQKPIQENKPGITLPPGAKLR